jgi:hypothetical protein
MLSLGLKQWRDTQQGSPLALVVIDGELGRRMPELGWGKFASIYRYDGVAYNLCEYLFGRGVLHVRWQRHGYMQSVIAIRCQPGGVIHAIPLVG